MKVTCENCFLHKDAEKCKQYCDNRSLIKIEDKGSRGKWSFINEKEKCVCLFKIDNCLIATENQKKCDFLFLVCDEKKAFFVEIKSDGSENNFEKAVQQILETAKTLESELKGFKLHARIAFSKTPAINSTKAKKQADYLTRRKIDFSYQQKKDESI